MIRPWKYASQKRSGLPRNDMDSTSKESNDKKYSLLSLYWKSLYDFHFKRHLHANVLTLKWIVFMNVHRPSLQFISTIYYVDDSRCTSIKLVLEPVCCKKQQRKFLTNYWLTKGPEWFQTLYSPDHPGSISYRSEYSEVPYFIYQELFFCFLQQTGSSIIVAYCLAINHSIFHPCYIRM